MNTKPEILVVDEGNERSRRIAQILNDAGLSARLEPYPEVAPPRGHPFRTSIVYDTVSPRTRAVHTLTVYERGATLVFKSRGTSLRRAKKYFLGVHAVRSLLYVAPISFTHYFF